MLLHSDAEITAGGFDKRNHLKLGDAIHGVAIQRQHLLADFKLAIRGRTRCDFGNDQRCRMSPSDAKAITTSCSFSQNYFSFICHLDGKKNPILGFSPFLNPTTMATTLPVWNLPVADKGDAVEQLASLSDAISVEIQAAGRWFEEHQRLIRLGLSVSDAPKDDDEEDEEAPDTPSASTSDDTFVNISGEIKNQDHYALLGLESKRWKATDDDIKKAYKKMVLKHHPDKKGEMNAKDAKAADEYFNRIQTAYQLLTNPQQRRLYDSVDDVDDSVPAPQKDPKAFFKSFGPAFARNSRWFETQPAPEFGDAETPYEEVAAFYSFWYREKTWREFGYDDDEDPNQAESREEKRWMEKQLRSRRKKQKKAENGRMLKLIDNAYQSDPRIRKHNDAIKAEKQAKKQAKLDAKRKEEEDRKRKIQEEKEAKAKAEKDAKEAAKKKTAAHKDARRTFTKACKGMGIYDPESPASSETVAGTNNLCMRDMDDLKTLSAEDLTRLSNIGEKDAFIEAVHKALKCLRMSADAERAEGEERLWSRVEQEQLEAAIASVPAKVDNRWVQVAKKVPGRTAKEVLLRIKACRDQAIAQASKPPKEWTDDEETVVNKAASKVYPPGTQGDRWLLIAQYIKTHAHTPWIRPSKDVIAKVNAMKNVMGQLKAKQSGRDDFEDFQKQNLKNPARNRARVEHMNDPSLKEHRADLLAHLKE
eukprot:m.259201 g.259201  ORF g.259201 m.259201 type:complete len:703 (-) comp17585_c0_seq4:1455-3563(-)